MTKFERKLFTFTNLIISLIGIAYFVYDFFFKIDTDFGQRPHPITSKLLYLHIITVPFLVFLVGSLYKSHVLPKLKSKIKTRKFSGVSILILFILMSISGYLVQTAIEAGELFGNAHIVLSFLWIIGYLWHFRFKF